MSRISCSTMLGFIEIGTSVLIVLVTVIAQERRHWQCSGDRTVRDDALLSLLDSRMGASIGDCRWSLLLGDGIFTTGVPACWSQVHDEGLQVLETTSATAYAYRSATGRSYGRSCTQWYCTQPTRRLGRAVIDGAAESDAPFEDVVHIIQREGVCSRR